MSSNTVVVISFILLFFLNAIAYVTMSIFGIAVTLLSIFAVGPLLDKINKGEDKE